MFLAFKNKGLIDINAITTMGVSAKEEGAIGYFGTGLKYAIACTLRNKGQILVFIGTKKYEFTTKPIEVRGKTFRVVYMNGEKLGFTDQLGKDWKPWMVVRELYCNAKDEGGSMSMEERLFHHEEDCTYVYVSHKSYTEVYHHRDRYFIDDCEVPIGNFSGVEIYEGRSGIFYKGIRVSERSSLYGYNLVRGDVSLTEDRTLSNEFFILYEIAQATKYVDCPKVAKNLMTEDGQDTIESRFEYDHFMVRSGESAEWLEAAKNLIAERNASVNRTVGAYLTKYGHLKEEVKDAELTQEQKEMFEEAKALVYMIDPTFITIDVRCVEGLHKNTLGAVKKIDSVLVAVISPLCLNTLLNAATTIYEEFVHITYGYSDESRALQQFLFNTVVTLEAEKLGVAI